MNETLLSIIVPVYNSQDYIEKTIDNLLKQLFESFEIIIVNDGSTDNTEDIIQSLQNKYSKIKYFKQKNQGPSVARNMGISYASGKYITFVDADDNLNTNFASTCISYMEEKKLDFLSAGIENVVINDTGEIEKRVRLSFPNEYLNGKKELLEYYIEKVLPSYTHSPCSRIYVRNIILENKLKFDPSLKYGEDLLFNLAYLRCCKTAMNLSCCFYQYMQKPDPNRLSQKKISDKYLVIKEWMESIDKIILDYNLIELSDTFYAIKCQWLISIINHDTLSLELKEAINKTKFYKKQLIDSPKISYKHGISRFLISIIICLNSPLVLYLFCKMTQMIKSRFRGIYYNVLSRC